MAASDVSDDSGGGGGGALFSAAAGGSSDGAQLITIRVRDADGGVNITGGSNCGRSARQQLAATAIKSSSDRRGIASTREPRPVQDV